MRTLVCALLLSCSGDPVADGGRVDARGSDAGAADSGAADSGAADSRAGADASLIADTGDASIGADVDPNEDKDGDGFVAAVDCDDSDPAVFPGAMELCDLKRTDCSQPYNGDFERVSFSTATAHEDLTALFATGTATAPVRITIMRPGTLSICPGVHRAHLVIGADVEVVGPAGAQVTYLNSDLPNPPDLPGERLGPDTIEMVGGNLLVRGVTLYGGAAGIDDQLADDTRIQLDNSAIRHVGTAVRHRGDGALHVLTSTLRGGLEAIDKSGDATVLIEGSYVRGAIEARRGTTTIVRSRVGNVVVAQTSNTVPNALTIRASGVGRLSVENRVVPLIEGSILSGVSVAAGVLMRDSVVRGGVGVRGGDEAALRIYTSTISDNRGTAGGGVSIGRDGLLVIEDSVVADNVAEDMGRDRAEGGGIFVGRGSTLILRRSVVRGNRATDDEPRGGGISTDRFAVLYVTASLITDNEADGFTQGGGGGIRLASDTHLTLLNTDVVANRVASRLLPGRLGIAGGLWLNASTVIVDGGVIRDNIGAFAPAVLSDEATFVCTGTTARAGVTGHDAVGGGGAFVINGSPPIGPTVTSHGCDWGDDGAPDNNTPSDLSYGLKASGRAFDFGDGASFVCDVNGCTR